MAKKKKEQLAPGEQPICSNPKAKHHYELEERFEVGIVLRGSEVKSLRARQADLEGAYASVESGELFLHQMHIAPYEQAHRFGHEAKRARKLLAHKREIERLRGKLTLRGYTLVPLRAYFKNGRAKVELALAKGKMAGDNREEIRRKLDMREARSAMERSKR
jgi:SsrA-binding protein